MIFEIDYYPHIAAEGDYVVSCIGEDKEYHYLHKDGVVRKKTNHNGVFTGWFKTHLDAQKAIAIYRGGLATVQVFDRYVRFNIPGVTSGSEPRHNRSLTETLIVVGMVLERYGVKEFDVIE
jgi:hypothetical protein